MGGCSQQEGGPELPSRDCLQGGWLEARVWEPDDPGTKVAQETEGELADRANLRSG